MFVNSTVDDPAQRTALMNEARSIAVREYGSVDMAFMSRDAD